MPRTPGSGNRIKCSFQEVGDVSQAPSSIVYMPEGEHTIFATVNGKPKEVTVKVDKSILAAFQGGLEERSKKNVRSITDFDHAGKGRASSIPESFSYEEGRGLILNLELTEAGRAEIEGKNYSYFSPDFLLGADGVPTGIAKRGPIGSLVNDPAFEDIERIAAARAAEESHQETTTETNDMETLHTIGLLTENEAAKEDAATVAAARVRALKDEPQAATVAAAKATQKTLKDAVKAADIAEETLESLGIQAAFADGAESSSINKALASLVIKAASQEVAIAKGKTDAAEAFVAEAVSAGKVQVKNDKMKEFWRKQHLDNPEDAVEAMKSQPKIAEGINEKTVSAATAKLGDGGKLKELADAEVKAGRANNFGEACSILMRKNPELQESYRAANYGSDSE